ncbi:MAG TPA: glutamate-5-semialdehyde dehydrogenase [Candidatus Atribacteria bacterium]|nr:glutamate-5-semialdehyde dehydrogenase [Candidatus Atribacteria bacterium]
MSNLKTIGQKSRLASYEMARCFTNKKNSALKFMAENLKKAERFILENNNKDIEMARRKGMSGAILDRLKLDKKRIKAMSDGLLSIAALPDPVGEIETMIKRPNGLYIGKKRVPLGVIGIIYEARPNVTVDASALCLKSGNAVILRGGSEAINSNRALVKILKEGLKESDIPSEVIQLITDTKREKVKEMIKMREYIDVLIPRGGASLIKMVAENSLVPVIETGVGNCHIYVDDEVDLEMAEKIVINAKTSRPAVCNAAETLLVAEKVASLFLPKLLSEFEKMGVEIRGCSKVKKIFPVCKDAIEEDWYTEYLDYIISVKVVKDIDMAIEHINKYGTKHSETIVTSSYQKAQKFLEEVDAAAVYVNASTRFTDGFEFGLGAEIGISTQKLHARGPMGLKELTTYKYIIYGNGQIR